MSILTINNSNKVIISDIIVDLQCSGYNDGGADHEICTVDNYELPMMVSNYQGDVYLTFEYVSGGTNAPLVLSISSNGDQPLTLSGSPYYFNSADILTLSAEIDKGYNINTLNLEKENLFIVALHNSEWDLALWLLKEKNISINVESLEGITPPNAVQFYEYQQKPKSLSRDKLQEMKKYITAKYNIQFPVLTRIQIQEQNEMKQMNIAPTPIKSK